MSHDTEEREGVEAEVIAAQLQMARAVQQREAANQIGRSGLASCGGESGAYVREAKEEADESMRQATDRLTRAKKAYLETYGREYEEAKPEVRPPSAKQKPDKKPKSIRGRSRSRRKEPWKQW